MYVVDTEGLRGKKSTFLQNKAEIETSKQKQKCALMAESGEELKSLLVKVKEKSEKSWLKTQHSEN